jgi:hypothetical protein
MAKILQVFKMGILPNNLILINDLKTFQCYIIIMSHLNSLPNIPDNMKYVCLSFLTDKSNKKSITGIRFGGAFATYDEACKQAKEIQQLDVYHNVFVGEGGKWLPFDPDPNSEAVKDSEYANETLNEIMKGHKENQEKAKIFHELRKNEKIIENMNDNMEQKLKNKEELTEKLSKAQTDEEMRTLTNSIDSIDKQLKTMEDKMKECKKNEEVLRKQTNITTIEEESD